MEMTQQINKTRIEHLATDEKPFHFTDSGLDNVYLVGIKYFESEDGTFVAEIPAAKQLMQLIARDIVFSEGSLSGEELRFLRKRLGKKGTEYAQILRIDAATLSRLENGKQSPSDQIDSLARLTYVLFCGDPQFAAIAKEMSNWIEANVHSKKDSRIVMKVSADNQWHDSRPLAAA
jgi:DNA-binding transcriptional regulator YiaG